MVVVLLHRAFAALNLLNRPFVMEEENMATSPDNDTDDETFLAAYTVQ